MVWNSHHNINGQARDAELPTRLWSHLGLTAHVQKRNGIATPECHCVVCDELQLCSTQRESVPVGETQGNDHASGELLREGVHTMGTLKVVR